MKRSVPADFDPVYPYDAKIPAITPPFITPGGGLDPDTPGLSINTTPPMRIENGAVALDYGDGLFLKEGKLETSNADPPLENTGQHLILNFGGGLTLDNSEHLVVNPKLPLEISQNAVSLKFDPTTLTVTPENELSVISANITALPPLNNSDNKLKLNIGAGLTTLKNHLTLNLDQSIVDPLYLDGGKLKFKIGDGLKMDPSLGLTLKVLSPLFLKRDPPNSTSNLTLHYGKGLTIKDNALVLEYPITSASPPLELLSDILKLKLSSLSGLNIKSDGLGINLNPINSGLELTNGLAIFLKSVNSGLNLNSGLGINLASNSGLGWNSNALTIQKKSGNPLKITNNELWVDFNRSCGLDQSNSQIVLLLANSPVGSPGGGLRFISRGSTNTTGLQINLDTNSGLSLNNGLKILTIPDGGLETRTDGLEISLATNSALSTNAGLKVVPTPDKGLETNANGIGIKITPSNSGLKLTSNGLSVLYPPNRGILINQAGIDVNAGRGLTFRNNKLETFLGNFGGLQYKNNGELEIKTNPNGGLEVPTSNGQLRIKLANNGGLNTNNEGLFIRRGNGLTFANFDNNTAGNLAVFINSEGGLTFDDVAGQGKRLNVKLQPGGGIEHSPTGLRLVNTNTPLNFKSNTNFFLNFKSFNFKLFEGKINQGLVWGILEQQQLEINFINGLLQSGFFGNSNDQNNYANLLPNFNISFLKPVLFQSELGYVHISFNFTKNNNNICHTIQFNFSKPISTPISISMIDFAYTLL